MTFTNFLFLLHPRLLLIWPCHDQQNYFFHFFATLSTSWSKEKKSFGYYAMIKRKRFSISALRSMRCGHRKRNLICIALVLWLRYDHEKNILFYFTATFTLEVSSYMILHLSTTLNTLLTCRKNDIFPRKNMCNFPQDFQWSLAWFTSQNGRLFYVGM